MELGSLDRVVRGDVDIGRPRHQPELALRRHTCIAFGLGGRRDVYGAYLDRLLDGFLGPRSRVDVIGGRVRPEQVHRHHRELQARPALQEEDLVARGHTGQLPQVGLGTGENRLEDL